MPFEKTDGMIRHTRLNNESREYLERREELRRAEVELIRQSEKVAALRRALPQGTPVQDYSFLEGPEDLDAGDAMRPVACDWHAHRTRRDVHDSVIRRVDHRFLRLDRCARRHRATSAGYCTLPTTTLLMTKGLSAAYA